MSIALAGVSAARRFGGGVLGIALAGGGAARRFGRQVLSVAWDGDVHAGPVTTEDAKIAVGQGNRGKGSQATGRGWD